MRLLKCRNTRFKYLLSFILLCCNLILITSCSSQSKQKHLARGEEYLQAQKFQEALMEFRAAADIDKNSAEAHWGLARSYENLGQFYETLEELRRVGEIAPNNLDASVKLGNYYLLSNPPQIDEALKILDDVFSRNPDFIEGHILKANILSAQEKPEQEVLSALNYAVSLDPKRVESYISLSRYYMKLRKPAEAEAAINSGIKQNPESALGYLEYGKFLEYSDRNTEAEAKFLKALEVEPRNIAAREIIAGFYTAQNQFDKAEAVYKQLIEIQENSPESRLKLANFYLESRRENEAIAVLQAINEEFPEFARARYRLGEVFLDNNEPDKVLAQVEELLKLNDDDAEALMLRARVRMQENKPDEAVKDLEEVLKKQPSQKNALFYMAQARLESGQIDRARAFIGDLEKYHPNYLRTKLLKIQANFLANEPEIAVRTAIELLENIKNARMSGTDDAQELAELNIRAITARGLANLELGKLSEARADLTEVSAVMLGSSSAKVNLAKVASAENNLPEAVHLYEQALAAEPSSFDALSGLVGVFLRQRQFDRAQQAIDQTVAKNNNRKDSLPAIHYLKADIFTAQKDLPAAERELKAAIDLDENYLPAYTAFAALLTARNQIDAALKEYEKVIEKKPSASVYTLIGMIEESRGNFEEAESKYRQALDIMPQATIAANNLAWLIANNQGNLDEALKLAQSAVDKNGNVAGYLDTLGWVYYKKELYVPAIEQLKKAVALEELTARRTNAGVNPAYRLRLGMALASAGDRASARREVEMSLQGGQNLSEKEILEAKNLLTRL